MGAGGREELHLRTSCVRTDAVMGPRGRMSASARTQRREGVRKRGNEEARERGGRGAGPAASARTQSRVNANARLRLRGHDDLSLR
jgi:hypothetical protein